MTKHPMESEKERDSTFELLRLIAMWMIVFYHFHTHVLGIIDSHPFYKAIQIPLHIGVPLFILLSGYFNIKFSINGLCKFLSRVIFYSISIYAIKIIILYLINGSIHWSLVDVANNIFCISRTDLWFVRAYFILYILSPFINKLLHLQDKTHRIIFLLILGFISCYIGTIGIEPNAGKSIINIIFIYSIGYTIHQYNIGKNISIKRLLQLLILTLCTIIGIYIFINNNYVRTTLWVISFPYNAPLLILISSITFICFSKFKINSRFINHISTSTFAVYLIHENHNINVYIYSLVKLIHESCTPITMYVALILLAIMIVLLCIAIDKFTLPFQNKLVSVLQSLIGCTILKLKKLSNNSN